MKTYQVRYRSETLGAKEIGSHIEPLTFRALHSEHSNSAAAHDVAAELRRGIAANISDRRTKALMLDSVSVE